MRPPETTTDRRIRIFSSGPFRTVIGPEKTAQTTCDGGKMAARGTVETQKKPETDRKPDGGGPQQGHEHHDRDEKAGQDQS